MWQDKGTELSSQLRPNSLKVRQAEITTLQIRTLQNYRSQVLKDKFETRLVLNVLNEFLAAKK